MVNIIKNIIPHYKGLSYLDAEDNGEGTLIGVSVDYIDTTFFNEEQYNKWENFLDNIDVIKDNFQLYCSWDKSGYNFWNNMNESNYTYIDIWISDNFNDNDIIPLINELDIIIEKINKFFDENFVD